MDINKAVTFVFKDERWIVKILLGAVMVFFSFLIIPIFFLYGYMIAKATLVRAIGSNNISQSATR